MRPLAPLLLRTVPSVASAQGASLAYRLGKDGLARGTMSLASEMDTLWAQHTRQGTFLVMTVSFGLAGAR